MRRGGEASLASLGEKLVDNLNKVLHGLFEVTEAREDGQPSESAEKGKRDARGTNLSHRALLESGERQPIASTSVPKSVYLLLSAHSARRRT
jgi:hypothetical protein